MQCIYSSAFNRKKKMKNKSNTILSLVAILVIVASVLLVMNTRQEASLIMINGRFYTLTESQPSVEAVAIRGDRIVAIGGTDEILKRFKADRKIDLQGRPAYPGFIDAHAHLEGLGSAILNLDLTGTRSIEEIQGRVRERIALSSPGALILGRGWDQNLWSDKTFPTSAPLDSIAPRNPVVLMRIDGHAVWVNGKMMDLIEISQSTSVQGGRIVRDKAGKATGVFVDNAVEFVTRAIPAPTREERKQRIQHALRECTRVGLTSIHDMGVDLEGIELFKELITSGNFPLRVYAAIDGLGTTWETYLSRGPEIGFEEKLTVRAIKLYADGAMGSRGAALIEPYSDDPGNRGLTVTSEGEMATVTDQALKGGFQVCIHAIGDRGNHIALNVYENRIKLFGERSLDHRFRVEHAQILDPLDIPRFAQLNVIPSMQPTHCTSDMYWIEHRLGEKRLAGAYAWRSLLDHGSIIAAGSDFPVESNNPILGFYAAVTRQDLSGWPDDGWMAGQKMTREEALKSFTMWAAYAGFEEHLKGSLEPGKLADITVLTNDIMTIPVAEIPDASVYLTLLGGEISFAADSLQFSP